MLRVANAKVTTFPHVSEAHCGYTSLHKYIITIDIFLNNIFQPLIRPSSDYFKDVTNKQRFVAFVWLASG